MSEACTCETRSVMILPCSGASNVGQIANQAALELRAEGYGRMYCIVGIGAHIQSMVQSARDVDRIVAIDGCEVCCARKLLEHLEIRPHQHVVVTQLGIEKSYDITWPSEQVVRVKEAVRGPGVASAAGSPSAGKKAACCT
jgi:uncharacterized metal-binding protein